MDNPLEKLESPRRIAELDPIGTLAQLGLAPDTVYCDIGAGTGLFVKAALQVTRAEVFAVDPAANMRAIMAQRFADDNVRICALTAEVPSDTADLVLLSGAMHEVDDKPAMIAEIARILRPGGKVCIIEFRPEAPESPRMGPPRSIRIPEQRLQAAMEAGGLRKVKRFERGVTSYCHVYERPAS